jgi:hypothetical protein
MQYGFLVKYFLQHDHYFAPYWLPLRSAIFLKKIGSGTHSDSKFSQRGGGVNYVSARKKGSGTSLQLASF